MSAKHITPRANEILLQAETLAALVKFAFEPKNAAAHRCLTRAKTVAENYEASVCETIKTVENMAQEKMTSLAKKIIKVANQTVLGDLRTRVKTISASYERKKRNHFAGGNPILGTIDSVSHPYKIKQADPP